MKMNMIDYNKAIEALEKERQYLLNREQYGAENVLVKHAINVISELPVIRHPEVIHCSECEYAHLVGPGLYKCEKYCDVHCHDWFCADGEKAVIHE